MDSPDEDDVRQGEGGLRQVATSQGGVVGVCEGDKSAEKCIDPREIAGRRRQIGRRAGSKALRSHRKAGGKTKGKEGSQRAGAHGGQIAESPGEGSMANRCRGVPIEAEVPASNGEVRGNGNLLAGSQTQDSAVVADAKGDGIA